MRNYGPLELRMCITLAEKGPTSTLDPYKDQALLNPWPLYRELREMGPAVWLKKYGMFALTRYDVVVKALRDWEAFPSSFGVMMNDDMNQILRGNTLCSDGDAHHRLRRVVIRPITPAALTSLTEEVEREAEAVVDRLCGRGRFCATRELATHLPMTIVSSAIGLPEEGRERMMEWSIGLFNCIGPMNDHARNAMPVLTEMMHYARTHAVPGKVKPGSWAEAIHHAAAAGEVPSEAVPVLMIDYMGPSLDTTIFGISSGVWLFANYPDQWDLIRNDPSLIPSAINEILRMEAPIQGFSRYVARTTIWTASRCGKARARSFSMAPPIAIRGSSRIPIALTSGATMLGVTWHSAPDRTCALA
jgi:cytochrome P450